jgi:4-hydroxy-tetrahydrodipicolinate synthase
MPMQLEGVYAASITPFDFEGVPALHALAPHLQRLQAGGCHGVLLLGTTGEGPSLGVEERLAVIRAGVAERGNLKVLAGTGAASLTDAAAMTSGAFDAGVDGVVIVPPFYYQDTSLEGLFAFYYEVITRAVPSDGAVFLYHIPNVSGVPIQFELIRRLRDQFPDQVIGIKDSSGNIEHARRLCAEFPDLTVFVGDDHLLADALEAGACGSITALTNIFPGLVRAVYDAFRANQPTDEAQGRLSAASDGLQGLPLSAAVKAILFVTNLLPNDYVRPPLRRLSPDQEEVLRAHFPLGHDLLESMAHEMGLEP